MTASMLRKFEESSPGVKFLHYLVFPADLFYSGNAYNIADREQRFYELTPIMGWLIPLILIMTTFTYLSGFGLVLYLLIQICLLVVMSIFYCWRISPGFVVGLFFNYLFSFILLYILLNALSFIFASCGIVLFIVFIIGLITFFSRNQHDYYSDDDW